MSFPLPQKSGFCSRLIPVAAVVFFTVLPAAVGSGISSALRPGAAFTRAWEKENLEGDFSEAAEEYERLYRGSGLPFSAGGSLHAGSRQLDRLRAAYRAGLCFEAVGTLKRARYAYQWLERNPQIGTDLLLKYRGDRGLRDTLSILKERSALRFRSLKEAETEAEIVRVAIAEVLEEFREYNRKDTQNLESSRQQILEQRWRVAAADELAEELGRAGIEGVFSDRIDSSGPEAEELRSLVEALQKHEALQGGDQQLDLRSYLLSCFFQRALDALAVKETDRAGRELSVALAIDPGYTYAKSLQASLERGGSAAFFASAGLLRRSRQLMLRAGKIRILARYLVSKAEKLQAQPLPRRDRVLRELLRANRICCSESAAVLADEELARLTSRIRLGCIDRAGPARQGDVEAVLDIVREQLGSTLSLSEELVRLFSRRLFQKNYLRNEGLPGAPSVAAVLGVTQAIKNETRDGRIRADKLRLEKLEFKLELLEGWFPELKEFIGAP